MAALPSPTQVAGSHNAIYEAFYHQVDPNNTGTVGALDAAKFLKKSALSDVILSKIWDLSDPAGKGYLNKGGFFVALKLVSLAQAGKEVNMVNITSDVGPPKMGDVHPVLPVQNSLISPPTINNSLVNTSDWAVKPAEKAKYDQLFDSLQPLNGMIPGNKVKGVLMDSKLPLDTLGKIWDLADMDKDGMLDRHEFMVAMHLVYKALEKYTIPNSLPPELLAPSKRKDSVPISVPTAPAAPLPSTVPVLPNLVMGIDGTKPPIPSLPAATWVVTAEEKAKYDILFQQTDVDKDGFVSGLEIKDVFLRSGVPQQILAHIWNLCDIKQSGKLNSEQFALSMWLIHQKLQGTEPPPSLTPEMVPPSFRTKPPVDGVIENNAAPYSNPELDMITKDIEELAKEKHLLETDIAQKEADIKIKNGEIKSLQSELDTLAATLKQLENQKGEAQKRLNDLKGQKSTVEKELNDIKLELEEEQAQVDNLRRQAEEQEVTLKSQEEELSSKKQELEDLKQEEARLEQQQKDSRNQLDNLTRNLQDTQLQISQAKAKITQLQEQHRQMKDAIATYDAAISEGDASLVSDATLNLAPEFRDPEYNRIAMVNGTSPPVDSKKDVINEAEKDPFSSMNGPTITNTSFGGEDFFKDDPFKSTKANNPSADPFGSNDPFSAAFSPKPAVSDGFSSDPFNSFGAPAANGKNDPFDPFGDTTASRSTSKTPVDMDGKDPFGCDPFATLQPSSGPPPRPESPSPALPPKKSKQPPPRPAPPRPVQQPGAMRAAPVPPTPSPEPRAASSTPDPFAADPFSGNVTPTPAQNDPFASTSSNSFADFANFDSKFSEAANDVSSNKTTPAASSTTTTQGRYAALEFTEDPFRNYRYEDPFNISDPFEDEGSSSSVATTTPTSGKRLDPFGLETDSGFASEFPTPTSKMNGNSELPPEDQQLAWAAAESLRLEEERRQRLRQEQEDLEYAIALSRADRKKL